MLYFTARRAWRPELCPTLQAEGRNDKVSSGYGLLGTSDESGHKRLEGE
ncbi:MAG: hypothetical protein P4L57_12015 [Rhizomicrobium sp.]|nr:hypothetical protein [Rhizomicrobium sp.]